MLEQAPEEPVGKLGVFLMEVGGISDICDIKHRRLVFDVCSTSPHYFTLHTLDYTITNSYYSIESTIININNTIYRTC